MRQTEELREGWERRGEKTPKERRKGEQGEWKKGEVMPRKSKVSKRARYFQLAHKRLIGKEKERERKN